MEQKTVNPADIENLVELLKNSSGTIHDAAHRTIGISGWFKAFVKSGDYQKMDDQWKSEAFDTYEHLKFILVHIDQTYLGEED